MINISNVNDSNAGHKNLTVQRAQLSPELQKLRAQLPDLLGTLQHDDEWYASIYLEKKSGKTFSANLKQTQVSDSHTLGVVFRIYDGYTLYEQATDQLDWSSLQKEAKTLVERVKSTEHAPNLPKRVYKAPSWKERLDQKKRRQKKKEYWQMNRVKPLSSAPIRRISESFTGYLPFVLVGLIAIVFGASHIYEWTHPEIVKGDLILEHKVGYLNMPFFTIRNVIAVILWIVFAKLIVGNSVAQDGNGDVKYTNKNRILAPIFLAVFAISFTMVSFDLLMSLDPHWFSTMFGVYCFAGSFYSSLALTAVIAVLLRRAGYLSHIINENHLHDLGKFMFAFTVFWAYIAFSQFMLIWYANLPEETMYFMHRFKGNWMSFSIFLLVGKFIVPFFALITRGAKRSESRLLFVGLWMLGAHWIDVLWLVQPESHPNGYQFKGLWIDLAGFIGLGGIFVFCVTRFLSKQSVVAIRDPKLAEAVFHHHQ